MFSLLLNGIMGLAMVIAMLFAATDIDKALASSTGYPYIEIFWQATNSRGGTAAMASLIIFLTISAVVGVIATTSRMFWAFARDRGLPFWRTLSKVHDNHIFSIPSWPCAVLCWILIKQTNNAYRLALLLLSLSGPLALPVSSPAY